MESAPLTKEVPGVREIDLDFLKSVPDLLKFYEFCRSFGKFGQVSLKKRPQGENWVDGVGTIYNSETKSLNFLESEFSEYVDGVPPSLKENIEKIERWLSENFNSRVGRVRFMTMPPKSCLSYHRDLESVRVHIPLKTSNKCFFVVDDKVYYMRNPGQVYLLRTDLLHTAINADLAQERIHLVINSYSENTK